jgi:CHAP domain
MGVNLNILKPAFNSKHKVNTDINLQVKIEPSIAFIQTVIDDRWDLGLDKPENLGDTEINKIIKLNTEGRRVISIKGFNQRAEVIDFMDIHLDIEPQATTKTSEKNLTEKVLDLARSQIGYTEKPINSNHTKYNEWYYGKPLSAPWCAIFTSWLFAQSGKTLAWQNDRGFAYCPYGVKRAKELNIWFTSPKVGDLVFFDWGRDGISDHIGVVETLNQDGSITTIEGNTSLSNDSNGGQVMRRTRYKNQIMGYARITI